MDILGSVVSVIGAAVGGVMQVLADFINLIIGAIPNPDPFPEIIENLDTTTLADMGFARYWLDCFCPIGPASIIIALWLGLLTASCVFAVIYWVVKAIKP